MMRIHPLELSTEYPGTVLKAQKVKTNAGAAMVVSGRSSPERSAGLGHCATRGNSQREAASPGRTFRARSMLIAYNKSFMLAFSMSSLII